MGAEKAEWGDEGFLYRVFPLLPVVIAWYEGEAELPPGASFMFPDSAQSLLPLEDIIVIAGLVVGRLSEAAFRGKK